MKVIASPQVGASGQVYVASGELDPDILPGGSPEHLSIVICHPDDERAVRDLLSAAEEFADVEAALTRYRRSD